MGWYFRFGVGPFRYSAPLTSRKQRAAHFPENSAVVLRPMDEILAEAEAIVKRVHSRYRMARAVEVAAGVIALAALAAEIVAGWYGY